MGHRAGGRAKPVPRVEIGAVVEKHVDVRLGPAAPAYSRPRKARTSGAGRMTSYHAPQPSKGWRVRSSFHPAALPQEAFTMGGETGGAPASRRA